MPLRWDRTRNPYTSSLFQILRIGPDARPPQIVAQANNLRLQLDTGHQISLAGHVLTSQDVNEASSRLREEAPRAEELLLTHWPATDLSASVDFVTPLVSFSQLTPGIHLPELRCPEALLQFCAVPPAESIPLLTWRQLGLIDVGDDEDWRYDILFDS